ncbi:hypothetical protein [Acidaminobacter sp.]|uniref:hypothetical protein n=1 Tax=Acidaminobacter sp. TaxID=1872102 RepID=UPI00137D456A|nr:hypothetical protein [Acidaminobacter sp.]MDK9710280.1 hypothetical protein [Acidaminobacter sp.]MZQ98629.1 hypothetical protein [Acidaminobacter sp.]
MEILKDLALTNRSVLKKAVSAFKNNLLIFLLAIPYMALTMVAGSVAAMMGFLGGILIFVVEAAIISDYLHIIHQVITRRKFDVDDFKNGFTVHFRKVYMVLFVVWVANYGASLLLSPILNAMGLGFVLVAIYFFAFVILNPLPEMIYQKYFSEADTFVKTVEFTRENAISWLVPNALIFALLFAVRALIDSALLPLGLGWLNLLVLSVVSAGLISFGMIYRGYLFDVLYKTTRRKRLFTETMYRN